MSWKQIKIFTAAEQSVVIEPNPEKDGMVMHSIEEEEDEKSFMLYMTFEEAKTIGEELIKYAEEMGIPTQTNREMKAVQTPFIYLEQTALEHYEEASSAIHYWRSDIPKAIKFYYKWKQLNFWGRLKLTLNQ